ncbi:MAG: type II toxin-antitoxin system VapC family toxin [Acidobacteriota bacterium]
MRRIVLDTSAYSAFLRGHGEIRAVLQRVAEILVIPVVLGELRAGFRKGSQRPKNEKLLEQFLASPRVRVIPLDEETADRYGEIVSSLRAAGRPIPTNDLWIAASAMQWAGYVVSTDSHFRHIPQITSEIFSTR